MGEAVSKDCAGLIGLEVTDPAADEEEQEAPTGSAAAAATAAAAAAEDAEEKVGDCAMAPGAGASEAGMLVGGCCRFLIMSL